MNKKVILFMCLVLLAACTGCKTEAGTEEETGVETESELITEPVAQESENTAPDSEAGKDHPVFSEESLACIEGALSSDDNRKYADYIAKYLFLSELDVDKIVEASVLENTDDNRIYIEVKDRNDKIYVVVVTEDYGLVGIRENNADGPWVFTVTMD